MDKTTPLLIMGTLLIILIFLVWIYVWIGRAKKRIVANIEQPIVPVTFESLQSIIHNPSSTNSELNNAVDILLEKFIIIGSESRKSEYYSSMLEKLCIHPNTDSKVILRFEKRLRIENPHYKEELENALRLGLAERDHR